MPPEVVPDAGDEANNDAIDKDKEKIEEVTEATLRNPHHCITNNVSGCCSFCPPPALHETPDVLTASLQCSAGYSGDGKCAGPSAPPPTASLEAPGVVAAVSSDERVLSVAHEVLKLVDDNRRLKDKLLQVSRQNNILRAAEEGLRSKLAASTIEAEQQQSPEEMKEDNETKMEEEPEPNLAHEWLHSLFAAVVIFLLGIVSHCFMK